MRLPCSRAVEPRSRTMAAKPPACSSRSVARIAWSRRVQGRSRTLDFALASTSRHRTQSTCRKATPLAAADSGSKASFTSTHAQTRPSAVRRARKASARLVRPEDCGPVSSLIAPTGRPPFSSSSTLVIPVAATSRIVCGAGVSAAGKRCARERSISRRSRVAEGMADLSTFAISSPLYSLKSVLLSKTPMEIRPVCWLSCEDYVRPICPKIHARGSGRMV